MPGIVQIPFEGVDLWIIGKKERKKKVRRTGLGTMSGRVDPSELYGC